MIQRRQTVFLFCVFLIALSLLLANLTFIKGHCKIDNSESYRYSINVNNTLISSEPESEIVGNNVTYALIINGLIALISIFLYKRRDLQLRFTAFNFLFIALGLFYIFYTWYKINSSERLQILDSNFQWALILPLTMIFVNFLALRGIRKDIELLASADRLR